MKLREMLLTAGFDRVIALDAHEIGVADSGTLLLALWGYEIEKEPAAHGAWIHPYYDVSQHAYHVASAVVREAQAMGEACALRDEIRVKPIFARLPGFAQGRNTLSYVPEFGSRFHVQIILAEETIEPDLRLEAEAHPLHCGDCRRCMDACPMHAIDADGFHRERCLRQWMLTGKSIPEEMRPLMGNRLVGCDECQRCCPHNPEATGETRAVIPLADMLKDARGGADELCDRIGANIAIPNRLLTHACVLAGAQRDVQLLPLIRDLLTHPSPMVQEHAAWAEKQLTEPAQSQE